jgi:hypothetical protein
LPPLVAWIPPSALLSYPRESCHSLLAYICFRLVLCKCVHPRIFANETKGSSPVTMWQEFMAIFVVSLWKSQSWRHSLHFACTDEHFRNPS